MTKPRIGERGVTVFELILVIAILGIVTLAGIPNIRQSVVRNRLIRPAKEISSIAAVARLQGINSHGQGVVAFHRAGAADEFSSQPWAAHDEVVVFLDFDISSPTATTNSNGRWDPPGEPIVSTYALGQHVAFKEPGGGDPIQADGWTFGDVTTDNRVVFNATGSLARPRATSDTVYLGDALGNCIRLVFNPVTGQIARQKNVPSTSHWNGETRMSEWVWVY